MVIRGELSLPQITALAINREFVVLLRRDMVEVTA